LFVRRGEGVTIGIVKDLGELSDEAVDLLFDLTGDNLGKVLDWLYGYNTALQAVPVDLMLGGRIEVVHTYLCSVARTC